MVTRRVVAVAGAAVLCLVACATAPGETPSPIPPTSAPVTPTSTKTPTPTATTPAWSAEQKAAVDTVEKWYLIYNEAMRGERGAGDFVLAGRGDLVNDAGRTYNQFALAELTPKGEILISELTPGGLINDERQTVRVELCQDMTAWQVLDQEGNDTLSLDSKVVRPMAAAVELWPNDGWYVTSISGGEHSCDGSES